MNTEEQTPEKELTVIIRKFDPEHDIGMLLATWRNSLWYDSPREDNWERASKFFREVTKKIKNLLKDPQTSVKIACLKEDPTFIVGYAVLNQTNLDWVYVKIDYRGRGVASLLTKGFETVSEPLTKIGKAITFNHDFKIKG